MKFVLLASVASVLAFPALAGDPRPPSRPSSPNVAAAGAVAGAAASNRTRVSTNVRATGGRSSSSARGGSAMASGGSGGAGGRGGVSNVTVNVPDSATAGVSSGPGGNAGSVDARQLSVAYAPAIPPGCGVAFNGGGAGTQGSGALGFSWETESCRKGRLAYTLRDMGRPDAGLELLCTMEEVREAARLAGVPCASDRQLSAVRAQTETIPPFAADVTLPPSRQRPAYCGPGIANSECL